MRVGIIGATGMLGHHTALALKARGHELTVVHRPDSNLDKLGDLQYTARAADLNDAQAMERALQSLDAVINCAAHYPTLPRPWREDVNIGVTQMENFYRACEAAQLKQIVYLGGGIALRKHPDGEAGDESLEYPGAPADKNPYVQVKWAMDQQALQKAREGLPVCIGIPTMTFGEYDFGPTTGAFIVETVNRTLPGYVNGKRNVIYAGDAGRGLALTIEKGRPGERYLITGQNMHLSEVIEMIAQAGGVPTPKSVPLGIVKLLSRVQELRYKIGLGPVPKISRTAVAVMGAGQFLDGAKAERELGYKPEVSIEEAVKRALNWFRDAGYIRE
ncbi:MAG: NAD-dependent epimerase/dehydratase family protein [bacterium]|nr:NAD-dependent epimerase/dehydratase family protein [bacterium]